MSLSSPLLYKQISVTVNIHHTTAALFPLLLLFWVSIAFQMIRHLIAHVTCVSTAA